MDRHDFSYDLWKGPRRDTFGISLLLHIIAVGILFKLATSTHISIHPPDTSHAVTLVAPLLLPPTAHIHAPVRNIREPRIAQVPLPMTERRAAVPAPAIPRAIATSAPAAITISPAPILPTHKPEPATERINSASASSPKTPEPQSMVKTGGFGNPNGVRPQAGPKSTVTLAAVGSFDMPTGPGSSSGKGGGGKGSVASAGFGSAIGSSSGSQRPGGGIAEAGFSEVAVSGKRPAASHATSEPRQTPVEILYKPHPAYTQEARALRIEGEVQLEVMFMANGNLRIEHTVAGLGHGLDQMAMQAAQQIRFRPATQDGQPCDSRATVHIVFQLAD